MLITLPELSGWREDPRNKRGKGEYLTRRGEMNREVNILSENKFAVLEGVDGDFKPYPGGVSSPCPQNSFLKTSMRKLGGGEKQLLGKLELLERRGGGIDDGWKYVHLSDRTFEKVNFSMSVEDGAKFIGIQAGCAESIKVKWVGMGIKQNLEAHPGPTYKNFGFGKKRDSLFLAWDLASHVEKLALRGELSVDKFRPRYGLAGRSKMKERESFIDKAYDYKPFGRSVWMADQHEQILCAKFSTPLLEFLRDRNDVVLLGFNKFGEDPTNLAKRMERFSVHINTDFERFDLSIGPDLITRAFDVMRYGFSVPRGRGDCDDLILSWLEEEFCNTHLVLPTGRVVVVRGGIPSGSGFTALIGTIINGLMWGEVLGSLGLTKDVDYSLGCVGDDSTLSVFPNHFGKSREALTLKARRFLVRVSKEFKSRFDVTINVEKTHIASELFVGVLQPRVPERILDGSRKAIYEFNREREAEYGRKLTFEERFIVLEDEPVGPAPGNSHRWTYHFDNRAKFLSHYFKREGGFTRIELAKVMMLRPTAEVIANLLHPERKIRNIEQHLQRLSSAVVEHWGNHHVVNHVMHYAYDAYLLQRAGVRTPRHCFVADTGGGSTHFYNSQETLGRRGWYREVDRVVDLVEEDPGFKAFWDRFLESARITHSAVFGGRYASWETLRALRSGRLKLGCSSFAGLASYGETKDISGSYGRTVEQELGKFSTQLLLNQQYRSRLFQKIVDGWGQINGFNCEDNNVLEINWELDDFQRVYAACIS